MDITAPYPSTFLEKEKPSTSRPEIKCSLTTMQSEQIAALNQIIGLIDKKATEYKHDFMRLTTAQRFAQKKLILDLVDDANVLGGAIKPAPTEVLGDLQRLAQELARL